jgi:hypothetical protein
VSHTRTSARRAAEIALLRGVLNDELAWLAGSGSFGVDARKKAILEALARTEAPRHWNQGKANGRARLRPHDVDVIRRELAGGVTQASLARRYGVAQNTILGIKQGRTWRFHGLPEAEVIAG